MHSNKICLTYFFPVALRPCTESRPPLKGLRGHTQTYHIDRATLDEWSALHRDLYLTTSNTHKRQISIRLAGFEPTIPASERPQTHALDSAAIWISSYLCLLSNKIHELIACEITVLYNNTVVICASLTFKAQLKNIGEGTVLLYTRWFKYDRDWFVCKQAALRSSCATLREWSHNLHPPSCSG